MGQIVSKFSDLFETIENELYRKAFSNEVSKDIFTYKDAVDFFYQQKGKINNAEYCLISVNYESELSEEEWPYGKKDNLVVRQILLDNKKNPILKTKNSYYGRVLEVQGIDVEMIKFMDGSKKKIFK